MPAELNEILDEYRHAAPGGHLVGGGALRALVAEVDRLRLIEGQTRQLFDEHGAPELFDRFRRVLEQMEVPDGR